MSGATQEAAEDSVTDTLRQMMGSLGRSGVGGAGSWRRRGAAPEAKLRTYLVQSHSHCWFWEPRDQILRRQFARGGLPAPAGYGKEKRGHVTTASDADAFLRAVPGPRASESLLCLFEMQVPGPHLRPARIPGKLLSVADAH